MSGDGFGLLDVPSKSFEKWLNFYHQAVSLNFNIALLTTSLNFEIQFVYGTWTSKIICRENVPSFLRNDVLQAIAWKNIFNK